MSLSSKPLAPADIEFATVAVSKDQVADLPTIVATISHSPIVSPMVSSSRHVDRAEWERVRHSAQADDFILAWIAGHVRRRAAALS